MKSQSLKKWILGSFLGLASASLWAQVVEKSPVTPVAESPWREIPQPERLPQITDKNGCRWGLIKSGTIGSSNHVTQAHHTFTQAGQLIVNDQAFEPSLTEEHRYEPRWRMTQTIGKLKIQREIWFDAERGGARYLDSVENISDSEVKVKMQLRVLFDECVDSLHPLGEEKSLTPLKDVWAKNTAGWLILPEDPMMRTSVLLITHDPRRTVLPQLQLAINNNLQTLSYDLDVPAKNKRAWLSWIIQRPMLSAERSAEVVQEFWRDQRLVNPRVDEELSPALVNFTVKSHQTDDKGQAWLSYLQRPRHELAESAGHDDASTDWVQLAKQTNLTGQIQGSAVTLSLGERDLPIPWEHIVAIDNRGRPTAQTQLWLHDGSRLVGSLRPTEPWKLRSPQGWDIDLPLSQESFYLRGQKSAVASLAPLACLHTSDEQIWLVSQLPTTPQGWQAHWGRLDLSWGDIIAAERDVSTGLFSLALRDGSLLQALPTTDQWTWPVLHLGSVSLHPARLQSWYQPEAVIDENLMTPAVDRTPLSANTAPAGLGCLLTGGTFLRARLVEETISLALGSTTATVPVADIVSIEKLETSSPPTGKPHTVMKFTFRKAPPVTGRIITPELPLRYGVHAFKLPVSSLILYRQP